MAETGKTLESLAKDDKSRLIDLIGLSKFLDTLKSYFYKKPDNGIPLADLDQGTRDLIVKADSAAQKLTNTYNYSNCTVTIGVTNEQY